jgi:hypothetical protein
MIFGNLDSVFQNISKCTLFWKIEFEIPEVKLKNNNRYFIHKKNDILLKYTQKIP